LLISQIEPAKYSIMSAKSKLIEMWCRYEIDSSCL